jgi:GNAT superfamily N-acetyltransferase
MLEVGPLPAGRIDEAVALLGRAFLPDPIFSYFFPDPARRSAVFAAFFGMLVNIHIRFGHVYAAERNGELVGAAVWRPPDAGAPSAEDLVLEHEAITKLQAIDANGAEGILSGFAKTESGHPSEPHWYLFFVGVEPDLQGQGIGQQLLAPVLEAADAAGTLCYLETPFPRTHEFYQRLGFHINDAGHPFTGAPTLWTMLRPPQLRGERG